MKIMQEANAFGLYQKTTIEINPDELKQAIKISYQGGDVDSQELEKKLDKALSDMLKQFK